MIFGDYVWENTGVNKKYNKALDFSTYKISLCTQTHACNIRTAHIHTNVVDKSDFKKADAHLI